MSKTGYFKVCVLAVLLLNLAVGYLVYRRDRGLRGGDNGVLSQMGAMAEMLRSIRQNYVDADKVQSEELLAGALNGMVSGLDEHSAYFPPREAKSINQALSGRFAGVGITTVQSEKKIVVVHVIKGSPAEKAGILPGDEIVAVDEVRTEGHSFEDVLDAIRGEKGVPVKITVFRKSEGGRELVFEMTREMISLNSVRGCTFIGNGDYGYFSIIGFAENTAEQLEEALKLAFRDKPDMKGIILDLRGNGGGLVRSAVDICSFFMPEGELVVVSRMQNIDRRGIVPYERKYRATAGYKVPSSVKLAVLIDRGSASASEITAGCLQDVGRALVVGEKSYGKGSVQTLFNVGGGNTLKMTVARYYTPVSNNFIDGVGVKPDVVFATKDEKYAELHRSRLAGALEPENDPQVNAAVEALKK